MGALLDSGPSVVRDGFVGGAVGFDLVEREERGEGTAWEHGAAGIDPVRCCAASPHM